MATDKLRTAALSILREGRLQILFADHNPETGETVRALARVQGHYGKYALDLEDGHITCTASPDANDADAVCAHALALRLVTGLAGQQ